MSRPASALAMLVDLLARRHALTLVEELRGRPTAFNDLARATGAGAPATSQRLRELRTAGVVEVDEAGDYRLTAHGRRLLGALDQLDAAAREWAALGPRQRSPRGAAERGRGEP